MQPDKLFSFDFYRCCQTGLRRPREGSEQSEVFCTPEVECSDQERQSTHAEPGELQSHGRLRTERGSG